MKNILIGTFLIMVIISLIICICILEKVNMYKENIRTLYFYIEVRKNAIKEKTFFDKAYLSIDNKDLATIKFYWRDKMFKDDEVVTFMIIPEYMFNYYTGVE